MNDSNSNGPPMPFPPANPIEIHHLWSPGDANPGPSRMGAVRKERKIGERNDVAARSQEDSEGIETWGVSERSKNESELCKTLGVTASSKEYYNAYNASGCSDIPVTIDTLVQREDNADRVRVDKFKRGEYGGKKSTVGYKLPNKRNAWSDCPMGGAMTKIEQEINAEFRRNII